MKKSKVNAQAAIEFLMTYGWVLVGVIIIIGALAYFGVFDVTRFVPNKCEISPAFECRDFKIAENAILLDLKNIAGTELVVSKLNYTKNRETLCYWTGAFSLAAGERKQFTALCPIGKTASKRTIEFELEYYKSSLSKHIAIGEITNYVEGVQPGLGELEICERAQTGGLCCALDEYYGDGTKSNCKTKYGLCDVTC